MTLFKNEVLAHDEPGIPQGVTISGVRTCPLLSRQRNKARPADPQIANLVDAAWLLRFGRADIGYQGGDHPCRQFQPSHASPRLRIVLSLSAQAVKGNHGLLKAWPPLAQSGR